MSRKEIIRVLLSTCLTLSLFSLAGCSSFSKNNEKVKSASHTLVEEKSIYTSSAKKPFTLSPTDTVIHEVSWLLSDHKKVFPNKNDVVLSSTFGNSAVVTVNVPKTDHVTYNIYLLNKDKNGYYYIQGIIDAPDIDRAPKIDSRGLQVPIAHYVMAKSTVQNKKTWVFLSKNKMIVLQVLPMYSVQVKNYNHSRIKGRDVWEKQSKNLQEAFYIDQKYSVSVTGNVGKKELLAFISSLPGLQSSIFPFSKN